MVKRGKTVSTRRADSKLWTDAGASHDAGDRAAVPARLHLVAAARARPVRAAAAWAVRPTASRANLPELEVPCRRQLAVEGEVQAGRNRGAAEEERVAAISQQLLFTMEGKYKIIVQLIDSASSMY